jgi:hypothetical protein
MVYKLLGAVAVLLIGMMVSTLSAHAAAQLELVRTLAENVLGPGQVTALSATDNGQTVLIRWESATYKAKNPIVETQDQLFFEAVLANNSIMGRLHDVARIRFTIMSGARMLATGEASQGRGTSMRFAPELGGNIYVPSVQPVQPKRPVTDMDARILSE